MLNIYDKAQWHIDAGIDSSIVIEKMKIVMLFLKDNELLSVEGEEILDLGVDSSISIHERMLTDKGNSFMSNSYNKIIDLSIEELEVALLKEYTAFENV